MYALVLQIGLVSLVLRSCLGLFRFSLRLRSLDPAAIKDGIFRVMRSASAVSQLSCIGISLLCAPPRIVETLFGAMDAELCRLNLALAALALFASFRPGCLAHRFAAYPALLFPACVHCPSRDRMI